MKQDFEGLRKKLDKISFPDLYLFNRDVGILRLVPIATLNEWIDADEDFEAVFKKSE